MINIPYLKLYIIDIFLAVIVICIVVFLRTFRSINIYKYKIKSLSGCWILSLLYIFIFFFIFNLLRIVQLGKTTDLYSVISSLKEVYSIFQYIPLNLRILLVVFCFLIMLIILLGFVCIHKYFIQKIIKLYVYYFTPFEDTIRSLLLKYNIASTDIISFLIFFICKKYVQKYYNGDYLELPIYHPCSIIPTIIWRPLYIKFFSLLPLLFFISESIICSFQIKYFYYFLSVYMPIMLLRRVTTYISDAANMILEILWDIYYKKETENVIYALSPEAKNLFFAYLQRDLVSIDPLDYDLQFAFRLNICFFLNYTDRNGYVNDIATLILFFDNDLKTYKVFEDEEYIDDDNNVIYKHGREWILLAYKEKNHE